MNLVSIVLPVYNGEKYLSKSISSILNQTYKNIELIIVDDCSSDNTPKIISEFARKDIRVRIVTNKTNKKLPESLNIGFSFAKGDYFTWTSDDNIFKPNAIEWMVNFLNNSSYDMVSCLYDFIDENGNFIGSANEVYRNRRTTLFLLKFNNIGACFLYGSRIARKVGKYDLNMFLAEDYDYWMRIASNGSIAYVSENLYLYRIHSESLTSTQNNIRDVADKVIIKNLNNFGKKIGLTKKQIFKIRLKHWWKYFKKNHFLLEKSGDYKTYRIFCIRLKLKRFFNSVC